MRQILSTLFLIFVVLGVHPALAEPLPAVRLLISNPAPYVGEELVVTLEIRTIPRPQGAIVPIWPSLDSCATAELPTPPPRLETEQQPVLIQIVQRAIRPLHSGRLPLLSAGVSIGGKVYNAPPVEIRVLPLPERGRQEDFAGAIGQVTMELEDEGRGSREVRLLLNGPASLETFPMPKAELGDGERLILIDDATVGSAPKERTRTLRYLYLPGGNDRGRLSFRLPVFNPIAHEYVTLRVGIRQIPLWLLRSIYLLGTLLLCTIMIRSYRNSRTPRTIDEALARIIGGAPKQLCRDRIVEILVQHHAEEQLFIDLAAYWQNFDQQRYAPLALKQQRISEEERQRNKRLLLSLIRLLSWWRWFLLAVEKEVTDQLRARMAKLSM